MRDSTSTARPSTVRNVSPVIAGLISWGASFSRYHDQGALACVQCALKQSPQSFVTKYFFGEQSPMSVEILKKRLKATLTDVPQCCEGKE